MAAANYARDAAARQIRVFADDGVRDSADASAIARGEHQRQEVCTMTVIARVALVALEVFLTLLALVLLAYGLAREALAAAWAAAAEAWDGPRGR